MKKHDFDIGGLNAEAAKTLYELQMKKNSGVKLDLQTEEALEAVKIASNIVNSIMSGKQVDAAFLKHVANLAEKKMNSKPAESNLGKRVKKKKKVYGKD